MEEKKSIPKNGAARQSGCSWGWPLLIMGSVVLVSDQSSVGFSGFFRFDKLAHFCVYGLMASLVLRALPQRMGDLWNGVIAVLVVSLFGLTDEYHQSFTPGRSVEFADWVADTLGAITAVWFYLKWTWYRTLMEWGPLRRKKNLSRAPASIDGEA
ncbi:MAG: VanZ family protein [Opitutaceae bacterium]|nr:VanZ family protein [Opitutaceae bacterium]